ncbi:Gcd10p family-domain-containing protein [Schizophyllum amplum]|uniref:tRNA (adenine(58)-N(1))-methyltransferase non-catalytic subunit TRM6 n=1 Tax=Schizophyllum amplum TaxID=97359 RepID=A0A550CNB1_9AGAR|nr:Gcd10p family-domain-containing protein [Auriculariopsis ampla]
MLQTRDSTIQSGNTVLLRVPSGDVRGIKIEKNTTVSLGRFGSFHANELLDEPYGLTYEIADKKLTVIPPKSHEEIEDTDATNELINDGQFVQPLTVQEIQALKQSGVHAAEIIKKQIEQHANYALKTEYSKEKYKKRKEAKYLKAFTTVEPTLFNVCNYWFNKDNNRIRDMRPDALAQVLTHANVRPGGRYIAVDDASGMLVAGILERMGSEGRLITICDVDSPPAYPVINNMNFTPGATAVLASLNWASADEDYAPLIASTEGDDDTDGRSDRQMARLGKRKATAEGLLNLRDELFAGEFDALIVASAYEPYSILEKLYPYLAGSSPIVFHHPNHQPIVNLSARIRGQPGYLAPTVVEPWLRQYQVLPGRTHPTMNTSGTGGYIFHSMKVYDDPSASAAVVLRQRKVKRAKVEGEPERPRVGVYKDDPAASASPAPPALAASEPPAPSILAEQPVESTSSLGAPSASTLAPTSQSTRPERHPDATEVVDAVMADSTGAGPSTAL